MQRYRIKYTHSAADVFQVFLVPDDDGDLCKYEDVEKDFKRIAALFATEQDDKPNQESDDQ